MSCHIRGSISVLTPAMAMRIKPKILRFFFEFQIYLVKLEVASGRAGCEKQ